MAKMNWYLQSCPVCGGDMHDDPQDRGWVVCFMCARSFKLMDLEKKGVDLMAPVAPRQATPKLPQAA